MKKLIKRILYRLRQEKKVPIFVPIDKDQILKGKVALITGGSSGIGFSIAKAFLNSGAKVIIVGSNEAKLEDAKQKLNNPNVASIVIDVKKIDAIPDKFEEARSLFKENRVDILVNSAGTHHINNFENTTEKEFDNIMDTNLKGTYFMCQTVCRYMRENGIKGHILNLSSSSAIRPATQPYAMSKWAIDGFTRGLARIYNKYGIDRDIWNSVCLFRSRWLCC